MPPTMPAGTTAGTTEATMAPEFPMTTETTTAPVPSTIVPETTAAPTTTTIASGTGVCSDKADDLYENSHDTNSFYQCFHGRTFIQKCPTNLVFNIKCKCCDWPK